MRFFSLRTFGKKLIFASLLFLLAQAVFYMSLAFSSSNAKLPSRVLRKSYPLPVGIQHINISVSSDFLQEGHMLDQLLRGEGCTTFITSPKILAHVWNVEQGIEDCVGDGDDCTLDGDSLFLAVDSSCIPKACIAYFFMQSQTQDCF